MAITMRARASKDEIKILMTHPSETGLRKGANGQPIPAHFVKNIQVTVNGKTILDGQWGVGVSKDPYLSVKVQGLKAGDKIGVHAEDNKGEQGSIETIAA